MNQSDAKEKSGPAATQGGATAAHERPCPECGEMVRKGLVRCWNCGAFMDAKLQKRYQEMQTNPAPPIFSEVPASEMNSVDDTSEDGFQLSAPTSTKKEDLQTLETAQAPAAQEPEAKKATEADAGGPSHSVATGGDVLLMAAMQEQAETREKRRRRPLMTGGAKTAHGFIIFCPYGCRIEVKEQHRGMQGKCPKCRAPFVVPVDPPDYTVSKKAAEPKAAGEGAEPEGPGGYQQWIEELHVHTVNPEKLKLKADSLLKDFVEYDFAFSRDGMLMVNLTKKGKFIGGVKNKADARAAILQHLKDGKPLPELPVGEQKTFTVDQLQEMRVVEPAPSRGLSLFHGIPIFGTGRIAVLLPIGADGTTQYVSMGVTQFRKFAKALEDVYGLVGFGAEAGIPEAEQYDEAGKCHFLGTPVRSLRQLEFYRADPTVQIILSGWKCAACGLIISEDARQKEKLGGKEGKGLAKVKCPKCTKKFGENPMYALKQEASQTSMGASEDVAEPAAT